MRQQLQWDDLRLVGAIADSGSLSGAARLLDVSHATVFRRLGRIEERIGVRLFDRGGAGYRATHAGAEVAATAKRMQAEVLGVERRILGQDAQRHGTVRVTTTDSLLFITLSPLFAQFRQAYPDITLEVVVPSQVFNLSRREADIAIRPSLEAPRTLVGQQVAAVDQAIYAGSNMSIVIGENIDLTCVDWVGPDDLMGYRQLERWMAVNGYDERCRFRVDSGPGMFAAVRDGIGVGVLPCYWGENEPELVRIGDPVREMATGLWLLTHPDLQNAERIRVVLDFFAEKLPLRISGLTVPN